MQPKRTWTLQPLFSCLILNTILLTILYAMASQVLSVLRQWVKPFLAPGATSLPAEAQSAFAGLGQMLGELEQYLALVVFGLGLLITLILWLVLKAQGRRLLETPSAVQPTTTATASDTGQAARHTSQSPPPPTSEPSAPSPQTAVQILAILQREGRLIDFLNEDLRPYSDDQIGAAVRSIHEGCQAALKEHLKLEPILAEAEGNEVTVADDFDPQAIRLTGNVSGTPPFRGTLRHHGWRVLQVDLPRLTAPREKGWILTPAEVEIGE